MASARQAPAQAGRLHVAITLADGSVEEVEVDVDSFTFREEAAVQRMLTRFVVINDEGRVVGEPTITQKIVVNALVVLQRHRDDVTFEQILDLPKSAVTYNVPKAAPGKASGRGSPARGSARR